MDKKLKIAKALSWRCSDAADRDNFLYSYIPNGPGSLDKSAQAQGPRVQGHQATCLTCNLFLICIISETVQIPMVGLTIESIVSFPL